MARPEMTARAITMRLRRTEQLRRLCLALRKREPPAAQPVPTPGSR